MPSSTHTAILWRAAPRRDEGAGPKVQLRAGPGQTRHELELPSEFEGKSPVDLHKTLSASDLKKYIVAQS